MTTAAAPAEQPAPAIVLSALAKRYGEHEAVAGVDLEIARGEFFGLLGPNGAGKTTTIGMLCGFIQPSRGHILIDGLPATPRTKAMKQKLGLVPQEFAFYPTLSARDNLMFFGKIFGLHGWLLRNRIDAVLEIGRLRGREREPVARYSSGMKRRLNIAIGLLHEPDILILDEPTAGVDAQSRNAILEALQQLNRNGITILYSTHHMEEAQRLCGRVGIMDHGRVIALGAPRELTRRFAEGLIEITFTSPPPETCLEQLGRIGTLAAHRDDPLRLSLQTPAPDVALTQVLASTAQTGAPISTLRLLEPSLESVFLKITGRQLRD